MRNFVALCAVSFGALLLILDLDLDPSYCAKYLRRLTTEDNSRNAIKTCLTPELDGEWVREVGTHKSVPVADQADFETCPNFTDHFRWKANILEDWNAKSFCDLLGNRTVVMIGDSTMRQTTKVLKDMLHIGGCQEQICLRNADTLLLEPMGGLNRGAYWTEHIRVLRPDIVVISAGAHIFGEGNFTRVLNTIIADIEELKKKYPRMQVVWKTQNPAGGVPNRKPEPIQEGHPFAVAQRRAATKLWNHHTFWPRDNIVVPELQKHSIPFIDMRMLYSRIDAHPFAIGDVLHFCLPGSLRIFPVLFQRLIETNFAVAKCGTRA